MSIDPAPILVLLLAVAWHEAAHAWVADRCGDPTARELGRVTLNPLKHLDPFLSFILPVLMYVTVGFIFGGGKPVPVNVGALNSPRRDFMFVALAGPGSNLVLAALFAVAFVVCVWAGVILPDVIPDDFVQAGYREVPKTLEGAMDGTFTMRLLYWGVFLNLLLAAFNLIPIPPLDGSRVVGWLLPAPVALAWYRLDRIGIFLILLFFYVFGGFEYVWLILDPLHSWTSDFVAEAVHWVSPS